MLYIYIHPPWKCLQLSLFAGDSPCAGTSDQPSFLNQLFWSFMGLGSVYISVQAMFFFFSLRTLFLNIASRSQTSVVGSAASKDGR